MRRKIPGKFKERPPKKKQSVKKGKARQKWKESRELDTVRYGVVPLVERDGFLQCDLDFRPMLPPGAVRANLRRQVYPESITPPRYFYTDEEYECAACKQAFVFSANEQQYWYEDLQFELWVKPFRCVECRRQRRNKRKLRMELTSASNALQADPDNPDVLLMYAQTTFEYFQEFQEGNLNQAIASARRALKIDAEAIAGLYWIGICQEAGQYLAAAQKSYRQFLAAAGEQKQYRPLVLQVINRLDVLADVELNALVDEEEGA